jgi:ankyrin repeat protein
MSIRSFKMGNFQSQLTPLHFASMVGSVKLLGMLIKHGAKIEAKAQVSPVIKEDGTCLMS